MTFSAFMIRAIRPCFTQATFLKTKYWSHYIDTERKMFDETCREHAKIFAKACVHKYFKGISGKNGSVHNNRAYNKDENEEQDISDDEKLLGVRAQKDVNKVLSDWHTSKPALAFRKYKKNAQSSGHLDGIMNGEENHFVDGITSNEEKKAWTMYYSKV